MPNRLIIAALCVACCAACAPITPFPGAGSTLPMPSPSGSPGGPSAPSMPGQGNSPPGNQSPGGQSGGSSGGGESSGGGSGGGSTSSYEPLPGGGGGLPGGTGGSGNGGEQQGAEEQEEVELGWENTPAGGGSEGDDGDGGWQTSNQIPADDADETGGGDGAPNGDEGVAAGGADEELDSALEDFDGEILAEREAAQESADANRGATTPGGGQAQGNDGDSQSGGAIAGPVPRSIPQAPAPPRRGAEAIPEDIPDAKDDDIIARQLREAAMAEDDPELKEKLWEEYRKYKKG